MSVHATTGSSLRRRGVRRAAALALALSAALSLPAGPAVAADAIAWGNAVPWLSFETALTRAAAEGKAIGVVVYADWCPKCRALAPQFQAGPVVAASPSILWVLQNHDDRPEWLEQRFGALGNYVPRIFFLRPDGTLDESIRSDHPRFPYFYLASRPEQLVTNIERAARAAGPANAAPPQPSAAPAAAAVAAVEPESAATAAGTAAPASTGWTRELPLFLVLVVVAGGAFWALRGSDEA